MLNQQYISLCEVDCVVGIIHIKTNDKISVLKSCDISQNCQLFNYQLD